MLLQPRAGTPTEAAAPVEGDAGAPLARPEGAPATNTDASAYISQEACEQASRTALVSAGGYTAGAAVLGVVVYAVLRKRLWGSAGTRLAAALGLAGALGTAMAAFDPVRADVLEQCMHSVDFAQYVFLGSQLFARSMVLGLVPALAATFAGCLVVNRT